MSVSAARAEEARAGMLELFPAGFEEIEQADGVELAAYTDSSGEERLWHAFGGGLSRPVESGWEERWRQFHRPVRVGALWVGPPWESPPDGATAVVIDPGRAFGTGAHATTRLCLALLAEDPRGSLLDLGCGSGVLAIAAAKLGFRPVTALDLDPQAVEATERNAEANEVTVAVRRVDVLADPLPRADVVVANITVAAVGGLAERVECDRLVTSGYLEVDAPRLSGFRQARRVVAEGWAADLHRAER